MMAVKTLSLQGKALKIIKSIDFSWPQISALALSAAMILFNPLHLEDYGDLVEADFFNALYSPFYGTAIKKSDGILTGQESIVVALFDEAYLAASTSGRWPVDPQVYQRFLRRLMNAGSIGVFIDINFQADDEEKSHGLARLYKAMDIYGKAGESGSTPVVFGGSIATPNPGFTNKGGQVVYASNYALFETVQGRQSYPLFVNTEAGTTETAATKMYEIWCTYHDCEPLGKEIADAHMFLQWGYGPDIEMRNHYASLEQNCQPENYSFVDKLSNSLSIVTQRLTTNFNDVKVNQPCMYHRNFSIYFLNSMSDKNFTELVENKLVFIGADIREYIDHTYSPINNYVPGVFRHAMALDNLIEQGDNYLRWEDSATLNYFEILLFTLIVGTYIYYHSCGQKIQKPQLQEDLYIYYGLSVFMSLLMVSVFSVFFFSLGPNSWVSYLLLFIGVSWPSIKFLLKKSSRIFKIHWDKVRFYTKFSTGLITPFCWFLLKLSLAIISLMSFFFIYILASLKTYQVNFYLLTLVAIGVVVSCIIKMNKIIKITKGGCK